MLRINHKNTIKKEFLLTVFLTAIITFTAILPTIIKYSGNLYLCGDYMTQLVPFIKEGRRMFLSGTPFWSANSFFGANFIGTYSYYVYGSPLFWPLLLFSEKNLCIGITIIFIIKHMAAGASSYLFLSTQFPEKNYAVLGALIYTFSSFTFDSTYYFIFLDVIAVFPLFLYFCEKALAGKNYTGFIFAVFLNATINYYCFIGTSVFFLIYLYCRIKYTDSLTFKNALCCILLYIAGVTASAVILLPAAFTLLDTSKAIGSFSKILVGGAACIPQIIKILRSIVLPSEGILGSGTGFTYSTFCSNAGFLPFFGAVFTVIALRSKENNWTFKLLRVLFIITLIPFGNGIFTLLSNLNYTRWWYALVMIMVTASLKVLYSNSNTPDNLISEYSRNSGTVIKIIAAVTLPLIIIKIVFAYLFTDILVEKMNGGIADSITSSGLTNKFSTDDIRYFAALVIMTSLTYVPLHILVKHKKVFDFKRVIPIVALICAVSYLCYLSTDSNVFFSDNISSPYITDNAETDKAEYTSRTDFKVSLNNYSMIVNRPSINTFNSFKSKSTAEFSRLAGFDSHSITKKHFSTDAIQTVLSIENVVDKDRNKYKAEYYCPFGYVYNYFTPDKNLPATNNKEENNRRIELMCSACILDEPTAEKLSDVVSPFDGNSNWKEAIERNRETSCTDFKMTSSGFTARSEGTQRRLLYFSIPADKGWKITVNGNETEIYTLNGGMIGIVVPEGVSEICASFYPPMINAGIIISSVSIVVIAIFTIINRKKHLKALTQIHNYDNIF